MNNLAVITQDRLKELLTYDTLTGQFTSVIDRGPLKAGAKVGTINLAGYVQIQIGGRIYYGHRLAWLYMTGRWPEAEVDHMDGNRQNNKWRNLRDVPRKMNAHNVRGPRIDNTSGFLGVSRHADGKWQARIKIGPDYRSLGLFQTPELASEAYLTAKRKFHPGSLL